MKLFHGSNVEIQEIDLSKSKTNKDFGCGFYLSADKEQAEGMARFKMLTWGGEMHVTCFELDDNYLGDNALQIRRFEDYSDEWAQFVLENRRNNNHENIHPYDIVYGPIADDKVGPQIRRLENGDIDMAEFLRRLKFMKGITFQYFFGSVAALKFLKRL